MLSVFLTLFAEIFFFEDHRLLIETVCLLFGTIFDKADLFVKAHRMQPCINVNFGRAHGKSFVEKHPYKKIGIAAASELF